MKTGSSLKHLLFGTATILVEELFRTKINIYGKSTFSKHFCAASTFSEELRFGKSYFFIRTIFWITHYFWRATFLERLHSQKALSSIAAIFSEEPIFHNLLFQGSYYFTATLPFQSHTSYLLVSN